jgi:hypothetical protein
MKPRNPARRGLGPALTFALALALALAGPAGAEELRIHGQLDLTESNRGRPLELNLLMHGDTPFDAYRLRLFVEGNASPAIQVFAQALLDEPYQAGAYGAYVVVTPSPSRDLHLVAGKIPWLIGTYAPRTYSDKKPLIGTPLMYFYHTTLRVDRLVPNADALLAAAGTGQYGPTYDASGRGFKGMPVVYDACWDFGGMVTASMRPLEFAGGFVNGTPGVPAAGQDGNGSKSVLGRVGLVPVPAIRLGVSGAYGAYLPERLSPGIPGGRSATDFHQRLMMADAAFSAGHLDLIAEGFTNTWETPTVGELDVRGYYAEGKLGFGAAFYAAGRWESMRFGELARSNGEREPWDYDLDRLETGLGYRLARQAILKAVFQRTIEIDEGRRIPFDLYALQLAVGF